MEIILILLLIGIFYFVLIRPQQKQRRQLQEVQASLTPGATVMTGSGLIGTVTTVSDDRVELEVAPGVSNTYVRRAIVQVIPEHTEAPDAGIGGDGAVQQSPAEEAAAEEPSAGDRKDDPGGAAR